MSQASWTPCGTSIVRARVLIFNGTKPILDGTGQLVKTEITFVLATV